MSTPWKVPWIPNVAASLIVSTVSAEWSSAFVGMQPRCRQVPPTLSRSTITTLMPSSAARSAAAYPPLPPPRTTRSTVPAVVTAGSSHASRYDRSRLPHGILPPVDVQGADGPGHSREEPIRGPVLAQAARRHGAGGRQRRHRAPDRLRRLPRGGRGLRGAADDDNLHHARARRC